MEERKRRHAGIGLGKREYTMAIIGENKKMGIHQGKTSIQGRQALYEKLESGDKAALEAGNLAFIMAREIIERKGCEVRVLNSVKLPFIWDTPTKTDKSDLRSADARKLARLSRNGGTSGFRWFRCRARSHSGGVSGTQGR